MVWVSVLRKNNVSYIDTTVLHYGEILYYNNEPLKYSAEAHA